MAIVVDYMFRYRILTPYYCTQESVVSYMFFRVEVKLETHLIVVVAAKRHFD